MKRVGTWLAVAATVALVAAPAGAGAQTTPQDRQAQIDQEMAKLRRQVGEASDQQAQLIAELQVTRRERAALDAKVAALDAQIATAQQDLDAVSVEVDDAVTAQAAADQAVTDARSALDHSTHLLRDQAVAAYIHFGETPTESDVLTQVDDVNAAARAIALVQALAAKQGEVVDEHKALEAQTTELQTKAAAAQAEVAERQRQLAERRASLQQARDAQAAARSQVAAEAANEQRLLNQVAAQKSQYLRQINELERESRDIAAQLARRQSGQTAPPPSHGLVGYPVANPVVTSTFGYRIHPIYGDLRLHSGVDFAADVGTPVFAAKDGTVVTAGWMSGYGNTVVIDHGGALATLYAHNSQLLVNPGDAVKRGQKIALAGTTGNSTGPHVHFEVRVHGTPVDPMNYL